MSAVLAEADGHGAWLEPLFDVAFSAPDGMSRLRQLILTLAMQGKLVPQLTSEAPASTLLKQIAAEKSTPAGKLHMVSGSSPISDSEKPYAIPDSWEWVRLGEITDIIRGITFPASEKTKEPALGRIACLRTANIQKEIEWQDLLYIDRKFMSKSSQLIRRDDIVMSMANSRELVGKVAIVKDMPVEEATFGGFLGVLRTHKVMPLFVLHLLNTMYARSTLVDAASQTTNIANISLGKLNPFLVPLPPLEEQQRIVARIDELMSRCDELESLRSAQGSKRRGAREATVRQWLAGDDAAAALLGEHFATLVSTREDVGELRKAILQLAVMGKVVPQDPAEDPASELLKQIEVEKASLVKNGKIRSSAALPSVVGSEKPYPIPDSWRWVRLGGIAQQITSGSRDWAKYYSESGALFVTMGNLSRGSYKLRMETKRYVTPPLGGEGSRTRLEESDLLISITGDVGNLGLIPPDFGEAYINQHTCLLRLMPACRTRYVPEFLLSPFAKSQFDGPQRGIKNSFRLDDVGEMLIPIPPLEEQRRIVARIDDLMRLCDALEQGIDAAQAKQAELLGAVMARV